MTDSRGFSTTPTATQILFPNDFALLPLSAPFSGSETETPGTKGNLRAPVAPRAFSLPTLAFSGGQGWLANGVGLGLAE